MLLPTTLTVFLKKIRFHIMGSFGELRISQQEVIQGAKFCQSANDLAVSSVPRVV